MYDVATFTLNPAVDHWSVADRVGPVHKVRTRDERFDPGGGGINVARVVRELGGTALAVYAAGGFIGTALSGLVDALDFDHRAVRIAGNTRMSHTVFDLADGQEYRFVPPGPHFDRAEIDSFLDMVEGCRSRYAVLSGSMPPDTDPALAREIVQRMRRSGAKCVADLSGEGLRAVVEEGVHLLKPNLRELESIVGASLGTRQEQSEAAADLVARGSAEIVALTLGSEGALLATEEGVTVLANPPVEVRSAVGAGDSFLAAMVLALAHGRPPREAFAYGVAAGAAAAMTPATELCHRSDVDRLYAGITAHDDR